MAIRARQVRLERVKHQFARPYHANDVGSQTVWVLSILRHPSWKRIAKTADDLVSKDGRPPVYAPSVNLAIQLVRVALGINLRSARRFVQGNPAVREELGLPPLSEEAAAQVADTGVKEFREEGFPSRTGIRDTATRWLEQPGRDALLVTIAEEAYCDQPLSLLKKFDLETGAIAMDVTASASALRRPGKRRQDVGALLQPRREEGPSFYHREKATSMLGCGVIVGGLLDTPSSERHLRDELFTQLLQRSRQFSDADGSSEDAIHLVGAALGGDTVFSDPSYARRIENAGFYNCARIKGGTDTLVATVTLKSGSIENTVDYTRGGIVYCSCDRRTSLGDPQYREKEQARLRDRTQMTQLAKQWDENRKRLKFSCTNPTCPHFQREFIASLSKIPTLNPLDHSDGFPAALNHLICNTIERYHSLGYDYFGVCPSDHHRARLKLGLVLGDTYNKLLSLLGDLVWNLMIERNLKRGVVREEREVAEVGSRARASDFSIKNKQMKKKLAREQRREELRPHLPRPGPGLDDLPLDELADAA